MFESAEIGHRLDRATYKAQVPALRAALLQAQYELLQRADRAVCILINGVDGAGRSETVNTLNAWMDPRHIRTEAFDPLRDEERRWPEMWRFWQVLPPKGHIGILFGSWYTDPIHCRVQGRDDRQRFALRLERIRRFERMLVAEGVVLVKFWFHLSKKAVKARYKALAADPRTAWRIGPREKAHLKRYDAFIDAADEALRSTSLGEAPWIVIDGSDDAYREVTAGQHLLTVLQHRPPPAPAPVPVPPAVLELPARPASLLHAFDYGRSLTQQRYERQLARWQGELNQLSRHPGLRKRSLVVVFEGMDAAGKGSTIRRLTAAWDARFYRVVPVAAPNENERAQPYLWRFWRYIPPHGKAVIFDRSWYGRVLVERVEGLCGEADWMRAYGEINAYEEELAEAGAIIVKFWLAITPEEQLRRFRERENTPYKRHKITPEDWRNREKWPQYERAVEQMVDRTSTRVAPWHIVASDDKRWARVEVLRTLTRRLRVALDDEA
ncbi:MAG: polyphosphate:AMP phosphotransferase [Tepidimonas ignava]|uniref:Polyphosphate:AMP phosphotransferase n=1 Tax=Tepidimonas ignava TaxID=114249 RepID=A0A4R3LHY6_9BURK|nr:polyphosphate:AMP phosphotransferase [Tepidimonas ignava]MCX7814928.1 polyphosphate:AMP phosphotransferase [Tepidimonas ignava]TCS99789.1 polyphosphate:AMP phosphotransferase [Tepidimonas ignava]TSE23174.1 Thymidylate kinase [Tepidimonas ignava]